MLNLSLAILLITVMVSSATRNERISVRRLKRIAEEVNLSNTTWKAKINFHEDTSEINVRRFVGTRIKNNRMKPGKEDDYDYSTKKTKIPENFDSREKWRNCSSIKKIHDQGNCGSCYAVATVTTFADRRCIANKEKIDELMSAKDLMTCCHACKENAEDDGCDGGYIEEAHDFLSTNGVVTGGPYNSHEGCKPYSIQPCDSKCNGTMEKAGKCLSKCSNDKYNISYDSDKKYTKTDAYMIPRPMVKKNIMQYGPVTAAFKVFEDFLNYRSGVYQHVYGNALGWHAVKMIGWGMEGKLPYWLVANSWGKSWGENGTFKIHQTRNKCNFGFFIGHTPKTAD